MTVVRSEALPQRTPQRRRRFRASTGSDALPGDARLGAHEESPGLGAFVLPGNLVGLRIVVVDDDPDSAEYFALALRTCGAVVITAFTAVDAFRLIQDGRPDVVVSDIAMVGRDGYWLAQQIRTFADGNVAALPLLAATAYGREHSRDRALAAGFTEHLRKPVDPELLCRTVGRLAGR